MPVFFFQYQQPILNCVSQYKNQRGSMLSDVVQNIFCAAQKKVSIESSEISWNNYSLLCNHSVPLEDRYHKYWPDPNYFYLVQFVTVQSENPIIKPCINLFSTCSLFICYRSLQIYSSSCQSSVKNSHLSLG